MTDETRDENGRITRREVVKTLPVKLTTKELLAAGREQADAQEEKRDTEGQMKAAADEYKGKIKAITGKIVRLANLVRAGYEHREVKCEQVYDYETGRVQIMRMDTAEIVEDRPLRQDEQQMQLPMTEAERIAREVQKEGVREEDDEIPDGEQGGDEAGEAPEEAPDPAAKPQVKSDGLVHAPRNSGPITDEELVAAVEILRETKRGSTATLQRKLRIGFVRACAVMEEMERQGWVSETKGPQPRDVYMDKLPEPGMAKVIPAR